MQGSIIRMGSAALLGTILAGLLGGCHLDDNPRRSRLVCHNPLGVVTYDLTVVNDVWYYRDGRWATAWGANYYRPSYYESCESRIINMGY